jgi:hypothetical protein
VAGAPVRARSARDFCCTPATPRCAAPPLSIQRPVAIV